MQLYIGTAGWSIPTFTASSFPPEGSHLQRYAAIFNCVEINSTFYRPHRLTTWTRWAASTPANFRFSIKLPRAVTHDSGLICQREHLLSFHEQIRTLGPRLGPLLIQLPPSQRFDRDLASSFLEEIRTEFPVDQLAIEPRHFTWFTDEADCLVRQFRIARVIADPPICPQSLTPGGDQTLIYLRLHGSPLMYYSSYDGAYLERIASLIAEHSTTTVWCIFDNTAHGHATENALQLSKRVGL